jgi:hypothetical protein
VSSYPSSHFDCTAPATSSRFWLRPRRAPAQLNFAGGYDLDEDAASDSGASEDDYLPPPPVTSQKRRRDEASDYAAPVARAAKRSRASPQSRNVQATAIDSDDESSASSPNKTSNPWKCPHCSWVQHNRRVPDLKRHIRTHMRYAGPERWVCCGVPASRAHEYGVGPSAPQTEYNGTLMVGGCQKSFSRRDALKRHLDNTNICCIGDLNLLPASDA